MLEQAPQFSHKALLTAFGKSLKHADGNVVHALLQYLRAAPVAEFLYIKARGCWVGGKGVIPSEEFSSVLMFILKSLADFVKSADADAKDVASVAVDVNDALVQAATHNAHFAVKSLLRYARDLQITPDSMDAAMVIASERGFALVVETIVVYRGVVPVATLLQALGAANKHGHHSIIELLLRKRMCLQHSSHPQRLYNTTYPVSSYYSISSVCILLYT